MQKLIRLITVSFVFLFSIGLANASALSCGIRHSCSGAIIFKTSATTNAHAEMADQTTYPYYVCCESPGFAIGNLCSAVTTINVLKLSDQTNAHVEENTFANYNYNACLSMPDNTQLTCEYTNSCQTDYTCLASISADTNAQVADCGVEAYQTKVCCRCSGTVNGIVHGIDNNGMEVILQDAEIKIMKNGAVRYDRIFTDQDGIYTVSDVTCGNYDIVASHPLYIPSIKSGIDLPPQATTTVDFVGSESLVSGSSCEADCTLASDNIIRKECDGINGCTFYDNIAKDACNLAHPGWRRDYDNPTVCDPICNPDVGCTGCVVECADGEPQPKIEIEAQVTCEKGNLIKVTKVVKYKGKLVRLVVASCG